MALLRLIGLLFLLIGAAFAGTPQDEDRFIRRVQDYDNLGRTGYERYPLFPVSRPVFSRMGNYVGHGLYLMRWDEIRERKIGEQLSGVDDVFKTGAQSGVVADETALRNEFGMLSVSHEGWKGRAASFFMGRGPTSTFSQLVLYQPDFSGVRADLNVGNQDISLIFSRGGLWAGRSLYSDFTGNLSGIISMSPVLLYGGHWQTHLGALELGASFLRQVQSSIKGDRRSLYRGGLPYPDLQQPKTLVVRVSDDSPDDQEGIEVYGVEILLRVGESGELRTGSADAQAQGAVFDRLLQPQVQGRRVGDHWLAQGAAETVDFTFVLPAQLDAESVEVVAQVAGDYRIGVRQVHDFLSPGTGLSEERSWPSPSQLNAVNVAFKDNPKESEPFYTVVRAEGNPRTAAPRLVRFRHAIPTGQSFYGLSGRIEAQQLTLEGELVANPQEFMFPTAGGKREQRQSYGGFLRLRRELGRAGGAGAEVFRLDPTYGGWYDSRRGGAVFFTDVAGDARGGETVAVESRTQEFPLYADNDDHDRWPDDMIEDYPYVPKGAFEDPEYLGGRPESGVYPGLDLDGDRIYDMDVNRNGLGDWFEPFFAYDIDPPDFVYGIDFNNNAVPDFRENDAEPDYPYRRDREGTHLFFDLGRRPAWLDRVTLGGYRLHEQAGGGKSGAFYARADLHLTLGGVSLTFNNDLKRVKDDIPDAVYRFVLTNDSKIFGRINTSAFTPPPDPLLMRDSMVNTAFAQTRYAPVQAFEVVNSFKYLVNRRFAADDRLENQLQDSRTMGSFTMVNKAQYTSRPLEGLQVVARLKHLLVRSDAGSYNFRYAINSAADTLEANPAASWSMFTPSLKVGYRLTDHTRLEYGQAGLFLPLLQARYRDNHHPANNYTSNLSIVQLTMSGDNQGYQVTTNVGVRWEQNNYDEEAGRTDEDFSAFFVDVVFGVE